MILGVVMAGSASYDSYPPITHSGCLATPVAFDPDVATAAVIPMTWDPTGASIRGFGVMAANPDVMSAVPAMESRLPDPAGMGGGGNDFDGTRRWRSDADHDLRSSRERGGEQ
jgi:hypothetical protein